ncbi:calcineurin-binding protein cabin-1-like isoform X2 [Cylas formicarius]|uniref:calcineurin-binding protein cabin-1-like isoform X2 n=1 Tax=Cylas formicarius TaxID=197179 RepID=UPI002958A76B|nr:calcineurin-binding protein cabin-1-like isoform X2 [Cylas formicarius]
MIKIRSLNRDSSSDDDVPTIRREAQEEIVLELYNKALRAQANKNCSESVEILNGLVSENIPLLENNGGLPKSMASLKFSCYLNLGNNFLHSNDINKALENYLVASELDATDVTLWCKIGKLSLKEDKFRQAAYAFAKGLECSEYHWPCLDNLISVLYALKDTIGCLYYIDKALSKDSEYTKGLILSKHIYSDNPASKEYYRSLYPYQRYQPLVDVIIDEEDEKEVLAEVQELCNKVIETEKDAGLKVTQTLPLPKPLEDYTWVSAAETIIYLHQYIADQELGHFTLIDLNKSMSQSKEIETKQLKFEICDAAQIESSMRSAEIVNGNDIVMDVKELEKGEVENVWQRRMSQTSDINNDGLDTTPVQTDNDEEQNMELDNDETDGDNGDTKNERGRPKGGKRKRDVLSDLQIWGWHSKRKQIKKSNKDLTVEDALNRIIPKNLLKNKICLENPSQNDDSMNTMDIYNMYVGDKEVKFLSPIHSPKSVNYEAYFGTDQEKEDVLNFWCQKRDHVDAIVLVKELVFALSKIWHYKWPKELVRLYLKAYCMFREHFDPPQLFCVESSFDKIRDDALATLLDAELKTFSSDDQELVDCAILGYLQLVSAWNDQWGEEFHSFFNRFCWLECHIFRKDDMNDLAIRNLELIMEIIEEHEQNSSDKYALNLPNCFKYGFITKDIVEKIIKYLNMISSLGNVENLYNSGQYKEVSDIIKQTFVAGSHPKVGRMGRPAQLGFLLHSLWYTDMGECFIWAEECFHEAMQNYQQPNLDRDKWEKIIEKCLGIFQDGIKQESVCIIDVLSEEKRCRLVECLSKLVCKQLNTEHALCIPLGTITPWLLLHYILLREEHRQYAMKRVNHYKRDRPECSRDVVLDDEVPPSIAILFSAHEFLGPKGWCLTKDGDLLHFILDTVLDRLDTPIFEQLRDKIDLHIEQALFCLYMYPSKKNKISRHLVDHNVTPLPLTWERSFQLYQYYAPDSLPEFNSYKNASISAELEQLLKRMIALVPTVYEFHSHLPKIMEYIHGKVDTIPEPVDFPNKVRAIYYLIGDYYFKQREFTKCIKYFQLDLCINPLRLDSWACLALSYVAQLDTKLNYCEKIKNETEFLDKANSAHICFKRALELAPDHLMLWIECGSFEYMVHSFCSRLIKYESENFNMEKFEVLESQKERYLDSSGNSFEKAITLYEVDDSGEADERWLQYYILGKIAEKKKKEPTEYLQYYLTASALLHENNATYPEKINYNNPQHLSVEALELHYRIHASVLKYLELHEDKEITTALGAFFKKCLNSTVKYFATPTPTGTAAEVPSKLVDNITNGSVSAANGTSFQEQFLNSIKNITNDDAKELPDEEEEEVKKCLEDVLMLVDKQLNPKEEENQKAMHELEKIQEVIMISDSDEDEMPQLIAEGAADRQEEVSSQSKVADVQELLDKMMQETMKQTENDDANNSGTDQIEEVVIREESPQKKVKASDSETDTLKTSVDDDTSSITSSSSGSSSSDSDSDDDSSSSSSSSTEGSSENMSSSEIIQLVDKCLQGLEMCVTRLQQNYKALYRLAHLFFNYKGKKDYTKCKQLLLGEYKSKGGTVIPGLFFERKTNNFFNGIWRIPSTEIDRPGSLAAHMNRCISLLLHVLRNTNDNKTLMELCMQLKKCPDRDKIYIKDTDRMSFSDQAMNMCIQSFKSQLKNVPTMTNPQIVKLLHDIFRIYQKVQKHIPIKSGIFSNMLVEVYRNFIKEKIPDAVNILDLAIKFCQQHKPIEKHRTPSLTQTVPFPRGHGLNISPIHPSPSLSGIQQPIKRPSGRPRGRPPLPKIPGQVKPPRARSLSTSGMTTDLYGSYQKQTFDKNFTYEYLQHYQNELVKQYSQNLSYSQLTQLSQLFTKGQLNNPAMASAITNQILAQAGLLNPPKIPISGISPIIPSVPPMLDNQSLMSSALKGKCGFDVPPSLLSGMSSDQMKYLENLLPAMNKPAAYKRAGEQSAAVPKQKSAPLTKTSSSVVFKESVKPTQQLLSNLTDDKTANMLMKDRPNVSITPVQPAVAGSQFTRASDVTKSPVKLPSSVPYSKFTSSNALPAKPLTLPDLNTTSFTKSASSFSKSSTVPPASSVSFAKPFAMPISNVSQTTSSYNPTSFAKINPNCSVPFTKPTIAATTSSSDFPRPNPLISPPSFMRTHVTSPTSFGWPVANTSPTPFSRPSANTSPTSLARGGRNVSPGKTLQEKLADKKKEQQSKQMMQNLETELSSVEGTSSAALLKSLNIANIPSSLTVSKTAPTSEDLLAPSSKHLPTVLSSSLPGHSLNRIPPALTVSKTVLPTPRFTPESGMSISQSQGMPQSPRKPFIWNPSF